MNRFRRHLLKLLIAATGCLGVTTVAAARSLKIIVYGGTGHVGTYVVNEALRRGDWVTVVARRLPKQPDTRAHLTFVVGDVTDSAQVASQVAGQDVIISVVNGELHQQAARSLVVAMRSAYPHPRLVFFGETATLEVSPGKRLMDLITNNSDPNSAPLSDLHALQYLQTVRDVRWSFLSPPPGFPGLPPGQVWWTPGLTGTRTGKYRSQESLVLKDAQGRSHISAEDLAVAILDEAEHPRFAYEQFTVAY
jgi:uncharacterized protein